MMIKYENECVGCPPEMGCLGTSCSNRNVPHQYCDCCEEEVEVLRNYDGEQLCDSCILEKFEVVDIENC